ncbi:MAG: hypothetical protein K8R56_00135 [Candidatus Eisenbacteria bacterium]|nr:hypothetical protein [Candidatus Eisenbacteria bacterium]
MRSLGHRRGNPTLRFMIDQTARRRMYAELRPEVMSTGLPREGALQRWSREFFERLHDTLVPRMAHVTDTPEGELRYFGSEALSVWALIGDHSTALAYDHAESPEQIRERARRWIACLTTRTAPGLASPHWGHPVYGARLDPLSGELDVVWAVPGEWCDRVLAGSVPQRQWDMPRAWDGPGLIPAS